MDVLTTVREIKALHIQGAAPIAKSALLALQDCAHRSKASTPRAFLLELKKAQRQLTSARPTEPYLRNLLHLTLARSSAPDLRHAKENLHHAVQHYLKQMDAWEHTVATIGAQKIPQGGGVFIHCHSSTVMAVLKKAWDSGKRFTVFNTEARPFHQGRMSAQELSAYGIPVEHYVDSAVRLALKKADVMMIGCDAITPERVVNKIGSELFAEAAERRGVPVYVCTPALKFDPLTLTGIPEPLEERKTSEVWEKPPRRVTVHNPAFEMVHPDLIAGIISELGIYPHSAFLSEIKRMYPELFHQ